MEFQAAGRAQYVKSKTIRQFMKPILNLQGEERILDVGCGIGTFGKLIQPFLSPKTELIGIDIDPIQVEYGNQHWAKQPNMRLEVGDATAIRYPDASFDLVASMGTLEFVDAKRVLSEMRRVLRCPGKLIVVQIDIAHYVNRPRDAPFEAFWGAYLEGMRRLGVDLDLNVFKTYCHEHEWVLEEFTLTIEYRVKITEQFLKLVENGRGELSRKEDYKRQQFEFNYQFVKHAGWSADQLWDFMNRQYEMETFLNFLKAHFGEDFYQQTPFRVYHIHFVE
ncbi:MAG: class I SAM-dependent methyltransferase [Candidatus Helarchaeota archaeon]|nr:class I SAM-dependent methyltransferase [Candidatus Helarchaeota archaeon]